MRYSGALPKFREDLDPSLLATFAQFERRLIAQRTREDARDQTDAECPAGLGNDARGFVLFVHQIQIR
jgi:hypothetical protein